jgi:signal transduction histidine kinase
VLACLVAFTVGLALSSPAITVGNRLLQSWLHPTAYCASYDGGSCHPTYSFPDRVFLTAGLLIVLGLVTWLFRATSRRVLRPVSGMTGTVRHMGPQNLGQRIRWSGASDELRELADAVDAMLDRVAVGFEGQRRFAANASHELRTPLAVQRTLVEVAMTTTNGSDPELNRLGAQLILVNERNERLIEGLLVLAESDRGVTGSVPVRLDELVATALDHHAELAAEQQLTVHRGLVDRTVHGDPVLLERMVANLLHNAIKYNHPGGTLDVIVADSPALTVRNSGPHVPAETVPALFEPFRRLTAERTHHRDGAGLGLSIVRSIVTAHHGTVAAQPGPAGGLQVTITLP